MSVRPVLRFAPSPNGLLHLGHEKPYQWTGDPRFTIRIADTAQELEKILSLQ